MPVTRHTVFRGTVQKFDLLPVMPELGEVVLAEHVGHHFRCQFFPDLIAGFCVTRIIEQISRGDLIHRPAHFQAAQLRAVGDQLGFKANKTVRVCAGSEADRRQK